MVEPHQTNCSCRKCHNTYLGHPASWYCYNCNPRPQDTQLLVAISCLRCSHPFYGVRGICFCQTCKTVSSEIARGLSDSAGIYKIQNLHNGKVYVGQSRDIEARWKAHRHQLKAGRHKKSLQGDYDQYGPEAFVFDVLELLDNPTDAQLDCREVFWARHHQSFLPGVGYNDADPSLMKSKKVTVELSVEDLYILHRLFQTPGDKAEFLSQVVSTALKSLSQS